MERSWGIPEKCVRDAENGAKQFRKSVLITVALAAN